MWCPVSQRRVVGSYTLSSPLKETVTARRYQEITEQFVAWLADERCCWLQQDGATAHTANSSMKTLQEFFVRPRHVSRTAASAISGSLTSRPFSVELFRSTAPLDLNLSTTYIDVSGQLHAPTALSPRKDPRHPLSKRLCGRLCRSGHCREKSLPLPATKAKTQDRPLRKLGRWVFV
jgi:hypothetical protein